MIWLVKFSVQISNYLHDPRNSSITLHYRCTSVGIRCWISCLKRWLELELVPCGTVTIAACTAPLCPGSSSSTLANFQNACATESFLRIMISPTLNFTLTLRSLDPIVTGSHKLVGYSFLHWRVNWPSKCWWCFSLFVKELYVLMVS